MERILSASPEGPGGHPYGAATAGPRRWTAGGVPPTDRLLAGELPAATIVTMVERVFGTTPVGLYGLTEVGYVGWQCERRGGYHLNADAFLVEVLRDGGRAQPGGSEIWW